MNTNQQEPSQDQYRAARATKAARMRELGLDPFGGVFETTATVAKARGMAPTLVEGDTSQPRGERVSIAGRLGNLRKSGGKLYFATLYDRSRADLYMSQQAAGVADIEGAEAKKARGIQLYLEFGALGEQQWEVVKSLDLADWIGVTGPVGRTRTGEISIFVEKIAVLGKTMLPPPHQAGATSGQLSVEVRARQRYLDLVMSDSSLATFTVRSRLIANVRRFFTERGYLEVETPMMQPIPGGATARPFITHHNALDLDLYMRVAPELYLKRLIVGGLEKVFELNRNFRNEGISPRHNPEFTMLESYEAFADRGTMMSLFEDLFRHLADTVLGKRVLRFNDFTIDLDKPWRRIAYHDAMREFGGLDYADQSAVVAKAKELGITLDDFPTYDRLANEVWEAVVEPHLIQPTFITDQPTWLTPLCKTHPDDPQKTLRFELFIARMEFGNAYTELNDPDLQRQRFREQAVEVEQANDQDGGVVQGLIDEDYCTALDHGLPSCGGQGLGIDRLTMLFTNSGNIRDVILFPTMRPEAKAAHSAQ